MPDLARAAYAQLKRAGLLTLLNGRVTRRVGDSSFKIPVVNGTMVRASEGWMSELLALLLDRRNGAVIDVGANLGQTLLKVRSISSHAPYLGFEPNPACVSYLRELIRINSFSRCAIIPAGLAERAGVVTLELYGSDTNPGASIVPGFRDKRVEDRLYVPVLSVRDIAAELVPDDIAIVKIDVEGSELGVLKGIAPLLEQQSPDVILEILPSYSEDSPRFAQQKETERFLRELGYQISRIRKQGDRLDGFAPISSIGVHADLSLCDYLLSKHPL